MADEIFIFYSTIPPLTHQNTAAGQIDIQETNSNALKNP